MMLLDRATENDVIWLPCLKGHSLETFEQSYYG